VTFKDPMNAQEASTYLALDESTVTRLAEARQIPAVKAENGWVFSRKSLQKWQRLRDRRGSRP
jgi:excisionase family DNA binding protein